MEIVSHRCCYDIHAKYSFKIKLYACLVCAIVTELGQHGNHFVKGLLEANFNVSCKSC